MNKNVYSLFGTSKQFDINFPIDYGLRFLCFNLYRHKTKPDVWLIKDISIGPHMQSLSFGSLHEEMIEKLYNHIISFLINKYAIKLIIFEVFAGSLWYVFEYSVEQAKLISTYPKIIDYDWLTFSNKDFIRSFDIVNIKHAEDYIILDKFEKDSLFYLKLLTKEKVLELPWVDENHEFFDLFNFAQTNGHEEFFYDPHEVKFHEGCVLYFNLDATFENE